MFGLIKIANDQQEKNHWGDAALAGGGGIATLNAKDRILGRKTLYHGTSKDNAAKIKQEGFKLSNGLGGASEALGEQQFIDNSKGLIHLTPQRGIANGFGAVAGEPRLKELGAEVSSLKSKLNETENATIPFSQWEDNMKQTEELVGEVHKNKLQMNELTAKRLAGGVVMPPGRFGGETLKMSVPYRDFAAMEADSDILKGLDPSIARQLAVRTDTPPGLEYIKGSVDDMGRMGRLKESLQLMPDYIKAHPGRFGTGVGLAGAGLAGMGLAAHNQFGDEG